MKKGFTLVELLAVVVIIGIVSILMLPKILERFENKKTELSDSAKQLLYMAAEQYVSLNPDSGKKCITIGELIDLGYLVEPVLDVKNNIQIPSTSSIRMNFYNNQYNYEFSNEACKFNVVYELDNVSLTTTQIDSLEKDERKEIKFSSNVGYKLPNVVSVIGANYSWDKSTGILSLDSISDNVIIKIQGIKLAVDTEKPTLVVNHNQGFCSPSTSVTVSISDEGGSGLALDNQYQYYLSTSNTELINGTWTDYQNNITFSFSTDINQYTPGTYYLWVYPVRDNYGNINGSHTIGIPYVVSTIVMNYQICYKYSGSHQIFTVPHNGNYRMNAWGAQGAGGEFAGKGGYTAGNLNLTKSEQFYVYVGGSNGYNGGGAGCQASFTGGGATDIRYFGSTPSSSDLTWNSTLGLNSRIMIAAGGGGNRYDTINQYGHGGGLTGITGIPDDEYTSYTSTGGNQTTGGTVKNFSSSYSAGTNGSYGQGGKGGCDSQCSEYYCGGSYGGGGGLYGGAGGSRLVNGRWSGGGGSSYISGHTGSVAVTSSTSSSPKSGCTTGTSDISCSYHYSNRIFTNTEMKAGNESMLTISSETATETGHPGDGFVRIKYILE